MPETAPNATHKNLKIKESRRLSDTTSQSPALSCTHQFLMTCVKLFQDDKLGRQLNMMQAKTSMLHGREAKVAWPLHEAATGICLSGLFVEHLAGHAEVIAALHEGVELFSSLQHAFNGLM